MLGSRATERTPVILRPMRQKLMIVPVVDFIVRVVVCLVVRLIRALNQEEAEEGGEKRIETDRSRSYVVRGNYCVCTFETHGRQTQGTVIVDDTVSSFIFQII